MVYYAYISQMGLALLCALALFMCWHWRKNYDNLRNELASFRYNCDSCANTNTHAYSNAHSNANSCADANSKTNANASSYTATNADTNTTSRPGANTYCAAHCHGNGGCYAC